MADNRKYYYLKLKESYFDDDAIVLLESMQDGVIYSNILLKLYLKSLKNGGKLQLDENIPYTAQMIATITRQQVGTVERALKIFMKLGLVEPLPSGALYMSNIELLIGQSSTEGERKRRARLALQEQKALPQTGADKCPPYRADICPPEIEIEKEIDIEIEKERELETGHPAPAAYGRYHNVILSDTELDGLKTELPGKWEYYIDRLSCHIASSGRKYKSHAATIFKWAQEDAAKKVVPVENGQTCRVHGLENLAFGLQDALAAAQVLNVGIADVGNHRHVRRGQVHQVGDLSKVVHPHLQHTDLVLAAQAEEGEGKAQLVVEVPLGFQHLVLLAQDGGHHVFGGGLAHTAGDAHHLRVELAAVVCAHDHHGVVAVRADHALLLRHAFHGVSYKV